MIPDIVEGTSKGFEAEDPYGNRIKILLDCIGCLTDFAEPANEADSYHSIVFVG